MATSARIGHGGVFAQGDGANPEVFTALGEVINITVSGLARDAVDATHMASTDRFRDYIGGLRDAGEVTIEMNWVPGGATETLLHAAFMDDDPVNYRITWPNADVWNFSAFLTGIDDEAPNDGKMSASVTYKITGKPAFIT